MADIAFPRQRSRTSSIVKRACSTAANSVTWLDLFCEDAVFWVPAVGMDGEYTTDPES